VTASRYIGGTGMLVNGNACMFQLILSLICCSR